MQAMEDGALDIEIQDHIDARDLPFTDDTTDGFDLGCDDHYGSIEGACGYLMYMRNTRSLRVCIHAWDACFVCRGFDQQSVLRLRC